MKEQWLPVVGSEWHDVSDRGNVRTWRFHPKSHKRLETPRLLKPQPNDTGYLQLRIGGKRRLVHRMVYESFIGTVPEGMQVDHLDANPANNRLDNLREVTAVGNVRRSRSCKLTYSQARAIEQRAIDGISQRKIAAEFGVSRSTVVAILNGATWRDEDDSAKPPKADLVPATEFF